MEPIQQSLVSFLATFISNQTKDTRTKDYLVRKMMKMKSVQNIIIDSMCKLDPIINQEILLYNNIRVPPSQRNIQRKSKLLTLAADIKNVMNNYDNIQDTLTSLKTIVETFDYSAELHRSESAEDIDNLLPSATYNFLSSISGYQPISNEEIDEISAEMWSKHIDVEKMLQSELEKYKIEADLLESKYYYRLSHAKIKTGIKIKNLEQEIVNLNEFYRQKIDRVLMIFEDMVAKDIERVANEESFLRQNIELSEVKDFASALSKIKTLLDIKKIFEKRHNKNEKLVKGLNNKLQQLLNKFSELQETNSQLLINFSSVSWCLGTVIESSNLSPELKNRSLKYISKQKCVKLETMIRDEKIFDLSSMEVITKKFDEFKEGIANISHNIKDEGTKSKINKLMSEAKTEDIKKQIAQKKTTGIRSATPARRNYRVKTVKEIDRSTPENAIDQLKQVFVDIDNNIKKHNRELVEDLEDLVLHEEDQEIESLVIEMNANKDAEVAAKRRSYQFQTAKKITASPKSGTLSTKPESENKQDVKYYEIKAIQATVISKTQDTQTTSQLFSKISSLINSNQYGPTFRSAFVFSNTSEFIEDLVIKGLEKMCKVFINNFSQTDPEKGHFDISLHENSLVRGLMNRKISKTKSYRLLESFHDDSIIEKIANFSLPEEQKSNIKNPRIEYLIEATEEYKKEFKIQSQIKGFKKLEFADIQKLWEEVINRRIIEGEKDRISLYLRGYLGTDKYESEKKKIIDMIETNKIQEFNSPNTKIKATRPIDSQKAKSNWKKLMSSLILKKMFNFSESLSKIESPTELLYVAARRIKFVKHRLARSAMLVKPSEKIYEKPQDQFKYMRSEKWILNSITPTLLDTTKVQSRFKLSGRNTTASKMRRAHTPAKDKSFRIEASRLPFLL